MGDDPPHRRQPQLTDDTEEQSRVVLLNPTLQSVDPQGAQSQAMEFATYPAHYDNSSNFSMASIANVLPDYQLRGYGQQSFHQHPPSQGSNMVYQLQQGAQFAGQNAPIFNPATSQQYGVPTQQTQQSRPMAMQYSHFGGTPSGLPAVSQPFPHQPMHQQQAGLQNIAPYSMQNQPFYQQQQLPPGSFGPSYAARSGSGYPMGQMRMDNTLTLSTGVPFMHSQNLPQSLSRHSSESSLRASVPRGPPRKPKQSGHALWVGNLPPGTNVIDLKDHFSRDANEDIESVFLISKSNCAFVNYKTETSCAAAMSRFHDSRFQGVRLVCRLRRASTTPSANPPGGPLSDRGPNPSDLPIETAESTGKAAADATDLPDLPVEKVKEKYFIVKSLTIEDLEVSARNGIWATQAHNEAALNQAYQTAENVYLVFSANKSGEYFGYARMASAIDDEGPAKSEEPPRPDALQPRLAESPITIPTPATATAPKGHIIDDSGRGTIFWEADTEEVEGQRPEDSGNNSGEGEDASPVNPQAFGKPFNIEWMSIERLPFYRTRGLRNPWNSNREVKIARDGTELEPSVGRRLVSMFHRPQMPAVSPNTAWMRQQQSAPGYPRPH